MVVGVVVNVYAYAMKLKGVECDVAFYNLNLSLGMYASYFVLFAHFFNQAYLRKGKDRLRRLESEKIKQGQVLDINANAKPCLKVDWKKCT